MPCELFVWYRCGEEQAETVLASARELLNRVATEAGVQGRLLQRKDAALTWMEHYCIDAADSEPFERLLAHLVTQVWTEHLPARHGELFTLQPA